MNIIVCIKQVPDAKNVRLDPVTNVMKREGVESIINPYDMYAVECALRLRDQFGGKVTALTMGPPQAEQALRQTVEYGVDEAVLLSDRAFAGADTWATSYTLAKAVEKIGEFDLIVCGKQASDGDTAQVGPGLAERLNLPYVCFVRRLAAADPEGRKLRVERMMDDGFDLVETPLPALITVVKEIAEPRVPSVRGKMKAKKLIIPVWTREDLNADPDLVGLPGSPTQVVEVFAPKPVGDRMMITGSPEEQVERLLAQWKKANIFGEGKGAGS
ncbi:MAG: electron transfer flavoprotein subunit beta/FixA family protein [Pseudomonadota bacterium]